MYSLTNTGYLFRNSKGPIEEPIWVDRLFPLSACWPSLWGEGPGYPTVLPFLRGDHGGMYQSVEGVLSENENQNRRESILSVE